MPVWLRRLLLVLLAALATAYAHGPLLGAGFLGDDANTLVELDTALEEHGLAGLWQVESLHGRPLAAGSLALSKALHATEGRYTPGDAGRLRLEGLLLLVAAALAMRVAVRRGLAPWTGLDHGRAAGFSAGVMLLVHPLVIPSSAHLADRGDALALALGLWAVAVYLAGRQVRSRTAIGFAIVLTVLTAASSPIAYGLPVVLAVLELASADRHRDLRRRTRTASSTFVGFAAAVYLERLVRTLLGGEASRNPRAELDFFDLFAVALEKLGVLVLPVNTSGVGLVGYALAVLAVLAALHPAFLAARSAPRLWGRILGSWAACIGAVLVLTWSERTVPAELGDARPLLAGGALMAAGLGVASTALSGARRSLLPALTVLVYAPLAGGSSRTIEVAAAAVGATQEALLVAGRDTDWRRSVAVLEPPRRIAGVSGLEREHEAALVGRPFLPDGGTPFPVVGVPLSALRMWTAGAEFDSLRRSGLRLLTPLRDPSVFGGGRRGVDVSTTPRGVADAVWEGVARIPDDVEVDSLRARALVVRPVEEPERTDGPPVLRWRGSGDEEGEAFTVRGAWVRTADGFAAVFDLAAELDWILAGAVKELWLPAPLEEARALELRDRALSPASGSSDTELRPRVAGDDWLFDVGGVPAVPLAEGERWTLTVWWRERGVVTDWPLEVDGGRLRAAGAAELEGVSWCLERRIDDVAVSRAVGVR